MSLPGSARCRPRSTPPPLGVGTPADGLTDAAVAQAFDTGSILRTHAMRPTWHFVAPADIRWLQTLTGPRVQTLNMYYARKNGLDGKTVARSRAVIERTLRDGQHRTRTEIAAALAKAGIPAAGQRLAYLMMSAELDQVICSGPRRGKQFTYALLDERAANARDLPRDEALGELTRRYFTWRRPWGGGGVFLGSAGKLVVWRSQSRSSKQKGRSSITPDRKRIVYAATKSAQHNQK